MAIPLYQRIFEHYRQEIILGSLKHGDRLPSEFEMSELFTVSRITVTRAVKELEQLGLVTRVKGKGTFVHLPQETVAAGTDSYPNLSFGGQLPIISVILPYEENIGYSILRGAEKEAKERGYYVTFHNTSYNVHKEREIIHQLRNDKIHGMIVYPVNSCANLDLFADMLISRFPFVVIDRNIEYLQLPSVVSDNYQGIHDIVKYLIDLGHRNIALVGSQIKEATSIKRRIEGYYQALVGSELRFHEAWVADIALERMDSPKDEQEKIRKTIVNLMSLGKYAPTAIVCINDMTAKKVMKEALSLGIKVPDELSITGFDNLPFCEYLEVPLTTVTQNFSKMGEQAVKLLFENDYAAKEIRQIVLETAIITRQSTCSPKVTARN
ncbi:GntR family transcriptional regulator [Paenibacillus thermotolerans]|uniref:GntR family transcriptional regulator n=1 Tax=Paenibacillus thermotolerans TaxID=3027807 RepID=UPI0023674871|nr:MULTISPECIES: GntR family transcriptional regulator [unclassified Paenibacillus]